MAKLKLDLHAIFNDGAKIEAALEGILREAEEKRIAEVEVIPGKGSGALKKTVLRFLDRPEVRTRYHRIVKDGDNWGRLFIYFRHAAPVAGARKADPPAMAVYSCFCCGASNDLEAETLESGTVVECPACGSPNRLIVTRRGEIRAESGY